MSPGDLAFGVLVILYLAAFLPPAMRRIAFESSIHVRCTPMDVFVLVSDPNNWPRYVPQLQLRAPVRTPVGIGDLIQDRVVIDGRSHDGVERVIVYEPGVRFGTQIVGGHRTTGVYELSEVDGGTRIVFSCNAMLTVAEAWAGNGFRRGHLAKTLKAVRDPILQRIKGLLEAEAAATV